MRTRVLPPDTNLLDLTPRREAYWSEADDGRVTVVRERPVIRGPRSLGRWLSYVMAPPRVRLDDVGSFVWRRMDGATDVRRLAGMVREEYGDRVEPVPERLGQLVRTLRRERLVSYVEEGAEGRGLSRP